MAWETITKSAAERADAKLPDPDAARAEWSWGELLPINL